MMRRGVHYDGRQREKTAGNTEKGCRKRIERLKLRWSNSVRRDIGRAEVNSRGCERMAEDRDGWRQSIRREGGTD